MLPPEAAPVPGPREEGWESKQQAHDGPSGPPFQVLLRSRAAPGETSSPTSEVELLGPLGSSEELLL